MGGLHRAEEGQGGERDRQGQSDGGPAAGRHHPQLTAAGGERVRGVYHYQVLSACQKGGERSQAAAQAKTG